MEEISLEIKDSLPTHIIIDCSMFSYIDTTGVTTLKTIVKKHEEINIMCLLTGCQVHVENMLRKDGFFEEVSQDRVYKSVHDAVTYIREGFSTISMPEMNNKSNGSVKLTHSPELLSATSLNQNKNPINKEQNNNNDYTKQTEDTSNETQIAFKSALKRRADPFSNSKNKSSSLDSLSSSSS
jgi:anti-anti-sigma regulatory factor